MKNVKTRLLVSLGMSIGISLLSVVTLFAEEIRQSIGEAAFVPQLLPTGQNFEVFRFDLPKIPEGSRIDFAGLLFHIQRDSVREKYLLLRLAPITGDWTAASVKNGQVLSLDEEAPSFAVANANREDKVELDITQLVAAWQKGEKANYGFYLVPELAEEETKLSVKSQAGVKAELVIYYTAPEKK